jgi:outer membrane protein
MKKKTTLILFFVSLFLGVNFQVKAQEYGFQSDEFLFFGGLGVSNTNVASNSNLGYNVLLGCGVFVSKKTTVNMNLDINALIKNKKVSIELFGRTYATPEKRFSFFGKYGLGYVEKEIDEVDYVGYKIVLFSPGINYFISKNISLEATFGNIGFQSEKEQTAGSAAKLNYQLGLDLTRLNFGILIKRR